MKKSPELITALVSVLIGVLFVAVKGGVVSIAMTILGAGLIIWSIIDVLDKKIMPFVLKLVIGIVAIVCSWTITNIILYAFAGLMIAFALYQFYLLIKNNKRNFLDFLEPFFFMVIGLLLIFAQGAVIDTIFLVAGISLMVVGAVSFINAILKKA